MSRLFALMLVLLPVAACRNPIEAPEASLPQPLTRKERLPEYQAIRLLPVEPEASYAVAMNDAGQVVVTRHSPDGACPCQGFLWQDGTTQALGTLGANRDFAADINEVGQIVGSSSAAGGQSRGVLWDNGVIQDLGTLHGGSSEAIQINEGGQIIGTSDGESFLWKSGSMRSLPLTAAAINNKGQIAGWVTAASGKRRAAVWHKGTITDLGTLGGDESWANAINKDGVIVGGSRTATGELHAFRWEDGGMSDLGLPTGWLTAEALFVNQRGDIAGHGTIGPDEFDTRGFFWSDGAIADIGTLGRRVTITDLNKRGVIVGRSMTGATTGEGAPFVWRNGVMRALPWLEGREAPYSSAIAVNGQGAVAGYSAPDPATDTRKAVLWVPESMQPAPTMVASITSGH